MVKSDFFDNKKIVVTGVSGFIGSRLSKELLQRGATVTAFARRNSNLWRIKDFTSEINWVYPDFYSFDDLSDQLLKINPDFIYHLATYYSVDNNVDFSEMIDTNIKVGALLTKAAARVDNLKLLINTGTCAEYGDIQEPANEESRLTPTTIYASTKAANTLIVEQIAADLKVPLTTLRLYNLYGEFEAARRIVPYIILSLLRDNDIKLTACEQAKDYSYIGDFANAYMQAAVEYEKARGMLFNIGSGTTIKMRRLVDEIAANLPQSKAKINFGALPYRENEMWYQSTSIEQAKKYLNWQPEISLRDGVKRIIDWYRNNIHLYHE